MPDRVPAWASPARAPIPEPFTWLSAILRVIGIPVMALLWWAVAFLPWKGAGLPSISEIWPPTLPVLFTDLGVAVFGSLGASVVVVGLIRRPMLALLSVLLSFGISALVTLTRGANTDGIVVNTTERRTMLVLCAVAALAGLAIGAVAVGSLRRFGFLGLLAVPPVASLIAVLFLGPRADSAWVTRSALGVLLVMIAWHRWSGVLLWPAFFALFWFLTLTMSAVAFGAQTLRHPGGGNVGLGTVMETMLDFVRSAWRVTLGIDWAIFWPAAIIAALVIAGLNVWRRFGAAGA
jgi:hypothetical protein